MVKKAPKPSHDVMLHPERMRIVSEFAGRERLSTAELHALLADIPIATLYRHLALLKDAGFLSITGLQAKRGAVEKTYQLATHLLLSMDDFRGSPDAFIRVVTSFTAVVLGDFVRYARTKAFARRSVDPMLRGYPIHASDEEFRELTGRLDELAKTASARYAKAAGGERRRRMVYLAAVPDTATVA